MLSRAEDIDISVYEAASCFTEIGAGVTIMPRVMHVIEDLGIEPEMRAISGYSKEGNSESAKFD